MTARRDLLDIRATDLYEALREYLPRIPALPDSVDVGVARYPVTVTLDPDDVVRVTLTLILRDRVVLASDEVVS